MKHLAFILVLFSLNLSSFAQVSGDIHRDLRKVVKDIKYTVDFVKPGKFVFKIVVDQKGNVKTCLLDEYQSTIKNNPMMMRCRDNIINNLKFEAGDYPQLHKGLVTITTQQ